MTDRRDHVVPIDLVEAIREVMRHELEDRASIKKNGHTWAQYLGKLITPERIALAVMTAFTVGGYFTDAKRDLREATSQAKTATDLARTASKAADAASDTLTQTRLDLAAVIADLHTQAGFNTDMSNKLAMSVTRFEFQSAIRQQIMPRLERIERRLDGTPR